MKTRLLSFAALLLGILLCLSGCEKDYLVNEDSLNETAYTKSIQQQAPSDDSNPNLLFLYDQFSDVYDSEVGEKISKKIGSPDWDKSIVSRNNFLLIEKEEGEISSGLIDEEQTETEQIIVPFADETGYVKNILISEFDPVRNEFRQKFVSRFIANLLAYQLDGVQKFEAVSTYAFNVYDSMNSGEPNPPQESTFCRQPCKVIAGECVLPGGGIGGAPAPCPFTYNPEPPPPTPGSGGSNPTSTPSSGGGTFENPTIVIDGFEVNIPTWYVSEYIDVVEWLHRVPSFGGTGRELYGRTAYLSVLDRIFNNEEDGGGGGNTNDIPPIVELDDCIEAAFPSTDTPGSSPGGDDFGSSGNLILGLLTDLYVQDETALRSLIYIHGQIGLTRDIARYLVLSGDIKAVHLALQAEQVHPSVVFDFLQFMYVFDPCGSLFPEIDFNALLDDPELITTLTNYIASNEPGDGNVVTNVNRVLRLVDCLGTDVEVSVLLNNAETVQKVYNFLSTNGCSNESSTEAARIYLQLTLFDTEFQEFEEEFEEAPSWWFPFVKEIAKEAILEILKRRVDGTLAGLPSNVIEAIDAISSGDIIGVLSESLDIAKRFFPALQGVDTVLDGIELYGEGTRAWRAISKLRNFGDELIRNTLDVVKSRTGGLLGKFRWANNSTGIQVIGIPVDQAQSFFSALVSSFATAVPNPNTSNPNNIAFDVPGGITLEFQPVSSSTSNNSPSIQIKKSGLPTIKLRLEP